MVRRRSLLRWAAGVAVAATCVLAAPAAAFADPPGPTDFETSIVAVEPQVDGLAASIVAGDSFFLLDVAPGVSVTVAGYQGEPYVEFLASGEVRENRQSPTYWLSRSKDGASVPDGVTAATPPEWVTVAGDGTYAWHDHRTHWMGGTPPGGPGDVVWDGTVPLVVDGVAVAVSTRTVWQAPPSPIPVIAGLTLGVAAAAGYMALRRRTPATAGLLTAAAAAAMAIGIAQYHSVPAVTGPPRSTWLLPATALVAGAVAFFARGLAADGLRALAGAELAVWAVTRRAGLTRAILPTDAPFWLDRAVTAGAGVLGVVAGVAALGTIVAIATRPPQRSGPLDAMPPR